VLAAAAAPAVAAEQRILLPSAHQQLQVTPPLRGAPVLNETRFPATGVRNSERVLVGIDATGKPLSVDVIQRLTLVGLGDYTFAVPGPVTGVSAVLGSASEPGLRQGSILWSGFSPGRKVLAARATLRLAAAALVLPFRLTITQDGGTLTLRGENVSQLPSTVPVGPSSGAEVAAALDATRAGSLRRPALQEVYVGVPGAPRTVQEPIAAPLRVTGEVGRIPVRYLLGDGGPNSFVLRVPAASAPKLRIVVRAVTPARLLTPPGGSATWVDALRRRRVEPGRILELASRARLSLARAIDYQAFLANPDPHGTSEATYVYETAAKPAPAAGPQPASGGNGWTTLVLAAAVVLAAGGLVVLWAHH
jgi:hypothetical protein